MNASCFHTLFHTCFHTRFHTQRKKLNLMPVKSGSFFIPLFKRSCLLDPANPQGVSATPWRWNRAESRFLYFFIHFHTCFHTRDDSDKPPQAHSGALGEAGALKKHVFNKEIPVFLPSVGAVGEARGFEKYCFSLGKKGIRASPGGNFRGSLGSPGSKRKLVFIRK